MARPLAPLLDPKGKGEFEPRIPNLEPRIQNLMYYLGRFLQLLGMWLLLVALFTAGPLGPSPRLFVAGAASFIAGWLFGRRRAAK